MAGLALKYKRSFLVLGGLIIKTGKAAVLVFGAGLVGGVLFRKKFKRS